MEIRDAYYGKEPLAAIYQGANLVWMNFDLHVKRVLEYAMERGFRLPSEPYLIALDDWIRKLKENGLFHTKLDVLYNFANDGDENFRLLNYIDPTLYKATIVGGVESLPLGFKGDGIDGCIETGYNPGRAENPNYTLNDAMMLAYKFAEGIAIASQPQDGLSYNLFRGDDLTWNRINQGMSNPDGTLDFTGSGLKVLQRVDSDRIQGINGGVLTERQAISTQVEDIPMRLMAGAASSATIGLSMFGAGASLKIEQATTMEGIMGQYFESVGLDIVAE